MPQNVWQNTEKHRPKDIFLAQRSNLKYSEHHRTPPEAKIQKTNTVQSGVRNNKGLGHIQGGLATPDPGYDRYKQVPDNSKIREYIRRRLTEQSPQTVIEVAGI